MASFQENKLLSDLIEQSKGAMAAQFQADLQKVVGTFIIARFSFYSFTAFLT